MSGIYKHLKSAYKRARGLQKPGKSLEIYPDDIFLVSFPKSGNTWTRFLIANLRFPNEQATFDNINRLLPDTTATPKRVFESMPRPRIIKSHECFDPRYPRVINVVRDPRDVVVSQYKYHQKIRKIEVDSPIEKFVTRFLNGETCPHGSWGQNVATWLYTSEGSPRYLQLRYEDLIADTPRELEKVAKFLNLPTSPELLAQAVERSSADEMRKMEKQQDHGLYRNSRKDMTFVRAAGSGGWHKDLPMEQATRIESAWGGLMHHLGYELETIKPQEAPEYAAFGTATNIPR
ncbi:MAG TPA: sulfotransferase domain-containing protein [Terriglobales bacterium]|nr:sulfotransferase domain-containing protein [Terriglobales bacterium]